eukprot:jgi/Botrbrau1/1346/Bobra.0063s0057.1
MSLWSLLLRFWQLNKQLVLLLLAVTVGRYLIFYRGSWKEGSAALGTLDVRQVPQNVRDWSCVDVATWVGKSIPAGMFQNSWAGSQGLICEMGLTGKLLYTHVTDDVLELDLGVKFRMHRLAFLQQIQSLQAKQPYGAEMAHGLCDYYIEEPQKAYVYLTTALTAPRFTILWLWLFDYDGTLGRVRGCSSKLIKSVLLPKTSSTDTLPPGPSCGVGTNGIVEGPTCPRSEILELPNVIICPAGSSEIWPKAVIGDVRTPLTRVRPTSETGKARDMAGTESLERILTIGPLRLSEWLPPIKPGLSEWVEPEGSGRAELESMQDLAAASWTEIYEAVISMVRSRKNRWKGFWPELVDVLNSDGLFWTLWLLMPGLQLVVAGVCLGSQNRSGMLLSCYMIAIGLCQTAAEIHTLRMIRHPLMSAPEFFTSFFCSHMLMPAMNVFAALLNVGVSAVVSESVGRVFSYFSLLLQPILTVWFVYGTWILYAESPEPQGTSGTQQSPAREGGSRSPVHWPPELVIPDELDDGPDVPYHFRCPITLAVMRQPAQTPGGQSYDKAAIMAWLAGHRSDPLSKVPLRKSKLSPNLGLRAAIEQWVQGECARREIPLPPQSPAGHEVEPLSRARLDEASNDTEESDQAARSRRRVNPIFGDRASSLADGGITSSGSIGDVGMDIDLVPCQSSNERTGHRSTSDEAPGSSNDAALSRNSEILRSEAAQQLLAEQVLDTVGSPRTEDTVRRQGQPTVGQVLG